ncbi:hypothetical protein L3049_10555 [Labilibaculum sp. DW002]|uniref:Uncharacterized protein n=1 Tax=Paralabilibaculum antarcticum TaxID=2912572 RepID=A0ABT5VSQ0_9BACT|nr:hypothetical protein [Labilibaculum sp. DW002]MDE5418449.1 hypothetical protein [Labilibaculum sp. DW002]
MKQLIIILLLIILANHSKAKDKPIPKMSFEQILTKIIPNDHIDYWEYRNYDYIESTTEVIFSKGIKPASIAIPDIKISSSFREGCHPTMCFDYIATVEDGKTYYIDETKEVCDFVGKIDNLEEGLFLRYIIAPEYYSINEEGESTGMYNLNKQEITFILLKDEFTHPKLVGQYKISINRTTHELSINRIETYYQEEL